MHGRRGPKGPGPALGPPVAMYFQNNEDVSTHKYIEDIFGDDFFRQNMNLDELLNQNVTFWAMF